MTKEEKKIIGKALDILYDYYCEQEEKMPNDPTGSLMKEFLFDEYIEYNNGNSSLLLDLIEREWPEYEDKNGVL